MTFAITRPSLVASTGNDLIQGTVKSDSLKGLAGNDVLFGYVGNDMLDGGVCADTLMGGEGSDIYTVDDAGDVIVEGIDSGIDLVNAGFSFTLSENVEILKLTGDGMIDGTGANQITGNDANNVLTGAEGDDLLSGLGGNDRLNGGSDTDRLLGGLGLDTLDGGSGADQMEGGDGNDNYVVDDAGDLVIELGTSAAGTDTVTSWISYALTDNVEHLKLHDLAAARMCYGYFRIYILLRREGCGKP